MSDTWFNLRLFLWHIQILKGHLFRPKIHCNSFWWKRELLWKPIWLRCYQGSQGHDQAEVAVLRVRQW